MRLQGVNVLEMATKSLESNLMRALPRDYPDASGCAMANVALNAFINQHGTPMLAAAVSILGRQNVAHCRQAA